MKKYALINGVIYTGAEILYDHALIVNDDKIADIVKTVDLDPALDTIDLQGANLSAVLSICNLMAAVV